MNCAQCDTPLTGYWQKKFCSPRCVYLSFKAPPRYCKCGKQLSNKQKLFCSHQCHKNGPRPVVENGPHDETIRLMAAEGASWKAIAKACGICMNAVAKRRDFLGIKRATVYVPYKNPQEAAIRRAALDGASCDELMRSFAISRSTAMKYRRLVGVARACRGKSHSLADRPRSPLRRANVAAQSTERQPIQIPLREVYTRGMVLNLPQSKRGDLAALNAAVRRENPAHPGFSLLTHQVSRVGLYAR